jgi:3-methyladenine DNA glycosylase/8-oxoguanine DNA glycosylase
MRGGGGKDREEEKMKITVDVDCTPEEARRFLGLPDLTPVHDAYVAKMTKAVSEGVTAESMAELMKSWGPMSEAGMTMWRGMLEGMSGRRDG